MTTTIAITGTNRGIGLALSQIYTQQGHNIIAICRQASQELKNLPNTTIIENIDITNETQTKTLTTKLKNIKIDILINNAGIFLNETLNQLNYDNMRKQYETHALGALHITQALLPNLNAGSKIAMITSRMGSIADNTSGNYYGYRMAKAAMNMLGKTLAEDLKPKQIAVALIHPGYVQTQMTDYTGDVTPEKAAQGITKRIQELTLKTTGTFWHAQGQQLEW